MLTIWSQVADMVSNLLVHSEYPVGTSQALALKRLPLILRLNAL